MVRSNRIRSTYQRRILDWLADGGGTVTEVSQALGIRIPHASAALKKLRESGDVARDHVSQRGSRYRLSSQGLTRLESDGLSRLNELVRWPPPPGAAGIVLAREGPMLLLGYASMPAGPLLGLPERPMNEESGVMEDSTGNQGESDTWIWAVQRGDGPVWWDLDSSRRAQPPEEPSSLTLAAWMERPKVMGIVRARILDETNPWPLGVGSWFKTLPTGYWPELPQVLRDGDAAIGRAGNSGPLVSPRGGMHARIGRRTDRSLLINSFVEESFTVADGDLLARPESALPKGLLKHWLKIIHPRLNQHSINERFERLSKDIDSSSSNALTRKLLNDFPGRVWKNQKTKFIDTRSLSQRGGEAALRYAIEVSEDSIVLDWRWNENVELLNRFSSDTRCKLLISESSQTNLPFILTSTNETGKFKLEIPGRLYLPISIKQDESVPEDWKAPKSPSELVRGNSNTISNADNELDAMWKACMLQSGNDVWADRHEKEYPLASWIATSKENQVARWRRIGNQIDPVWAGLADMTIFDDDDLADLALVDDKALSILIARIRNNPLRILSKTVTNPAIATAILLSTEWIDIDADVIDCWLTNPLRVSDVLRRNWGKSEIGRLVDACQHHSVLFNNSKIHDRIQILAIMEDVHYSLWKEHSVEWLSICLGSTIGRNALSMLDLPWPAIVYEQNLDSGDLVLIHHMPDGIGTDSLKDVLEGLEARENNRPPSQGRTHPLAGWLFQELVPQPELDTEYDLDIHIALHRRFEQ